jgi:hypothetical protein
MNGCIIMWSEIEFCKEWREKVESEITMPSEIKTKKKKM